MIHQNVDPLGSAINDYFESGTSNDIIVSSDIAEDDVIPSSYFFRTYNTMPELEKIALSHCSGKILDVGAAAGCHSLHLQNLGCDVAAMDVSELCCKVMLKRRISHVITEDIFNYSGEQFDTILMLMNGIGIAGNLKKLGDLLVNIHCMLQPGGQIIFDSSDIDYLYHDEGGKLINLNSNYYGELIYTMSYKKIQGNPFEWLFIDYNTLVPIAQKHGYETSILATGNHYDYLVVLKKK